jgi:glycosyl hydrolase family 18 (putative chitinase)
MAQGGVMNIKRFILGLVVATFSSMSVIGMSASASSQVRHPDNAVWLGHAYVTTQSYVEKVPSLAHDMKEDYRVLYWFVNVGKVNSSGQIIGGPAGLGKAVAFLNELNRWEASHRYRFKVVAWINGTLTTTDADFIDVGNAAKRQVVVNECKKLISTTVPDSYVPGATRAFDGIQIDFEPSGFDSARFDNLKTLMDEIRSAFTASPGKLTSFAAPKYGTTSRWFWSPTFYYYMGRHVDLLAAMTYDSKLIAGTAYQDWIRDQTRDILRSVSGKFWNNDSTHPAPINGVKVIIGFPAFPPTAVHNLDAENIKYAAPGVDAGLNILESHGDPSRSYFQGAGVFLHTDGTGRDNYANKATDWRHFGHYWLQAW